MMKVLFFVIVSILGVVNATADKEKDHNNKAHKALCDLMKAAVGKWGDGGQGLSKPLKKALGRTLFGKVEGGDLSDIKGLPKDYNEVEGTDSSRGNWCGQPYEGGFNGVNQARWAGHSAPHDMVCLCTVGEKGWPLNESDNRIEKLCGLEKKALEAEDNQGWGYTKHEGNKHVTATWTKIVTPCLEEKVGKDLKQALNDFLRKLVNKSSDFYSNRFQLGEGDPYDSYACTGSATYGVCVEYYNTTGLWYPMPWWVDLQKALPEEEKFQEEKKKLEEEERRRHQEDREKTNPAQTEALKSTHTSTNQTERSQNDNITDKLRRLNLTSGTPISLPSSWLLRAVFLF
ncbi:Variant surface glycoprotein [Trypanosoma congolense IL3000]|uniref:Variant surface glycoprotein n=1 Tax=Trypanosoma congolense (strain IL3000) TaxID=1068625 RepID=F9W6Z4_TRYCI|nr:Variant surface glycoprotein [Trypanosoma congolense IL3000]